MMFQIRNELGGQSLAPGSIVHAVGELVGSRGAGFIEQHPDHRRRRAISHGRVDIDRRVHEIAEPAAETVGEIDRGPGLARVRRIAGRGHHPAAHVDRSAPESGKRRADEIDFPGVGARSGRPGLVIGGRRGGRGPGIAPLWKNRGQRNRPAGRKLHLGHRADEIARLAPAIGVVVMDVEHGLDGVGPRRKLRKGGGKGDEVGVHRDRRTGRGVANLLGGDGRAMRGEAGIDLLDRGDLSPVQRLGEQQKPAGYGRFQIGGHRHANESGVGEGAASQRRQREDRRGQDTRPPHDRFPRRPDPGAEQLR